MTIEIIIEQMKRRDHLHAESAGLVWGEATGRIKEVAAALDSIDAELKPHLVPGPLLQGFYMGFEDFSDLWCLGEAYPIAFFAGSLDFLAREASQETGLGEASNWRQMVHIYGPAVVEPMYAIARDVVASIRQEYRRLQKSVGDTGDEMIIGPIGADDDAFEEASVALCAPDDEHAQLISIAAVDDGLMQTLKDLLLTRDKAARRALRGEPF